MYDIIYGTYSSSLDCKWLQCLFKNIYVFNLTLCLLIPKKGELSAHVAQCTDISTKKILFSKLQSPFSTYNHQE